MALIEERLADMFLDSGRNRCSPPCSDSSSGTRLAVVMSCRCAPLTVVWIGQLALRLRLRSGLGRTGVACSRRGGCERCGLL